MCVVSMIGDHYDDKWKDFKKLIPQTPYNPPGQSPYFPPIGVTKEEFDELKKEVLNMKELLKRAKIYDEQNNEPNCETFDKMEFLKAIAKLVGVDLDDVLKK